MNRNTKIKIVILAVFAIILMSFQVIALNIFSTNGAKLSEMRKMISDIDDENSNLSQKIASSSAIGNLAKKAEGYGFTEAVKVITFSSSTPLAHSFDTSL